MFLWVCSLWFVFKDTPWHAGLTGPLSSLYRKKEESAEGTGGECVCVCDVRVCVCDVRVCVVCVCVCVCDTTTLTDNIINITVFRYCIRSDCLEMLQ